MEENSELILTTVLHARVQTHFISEIWNTVSLLFILTLTSQARSLTNTHRHSPYSICLFKNVISILQKTGFLSSHTLILLPLQRQWWILFILTEEICILRIPALAYQPLRESHSYLSLIWPSFILQMRQETVQPDCSYKHQKRPLIVSLAKLPPQNTSRWDLASDYVYPSTQEILHQTFCYCCWCRHRRSIMWIN